MVIQASPCPDYLMHHGIKGQKWGERRFQYEDGSWTSAGKERYGKSERSSGYATEFIGKVYKANREYNKSREENYKNYKDTKRSARDKKKIALAEAQTKGEKTAARVEFRSEKRTAKRAFEKQDEEAIDKRQEKMYKNTSYGKIAASSALQIGGGLLVKGVSSVTGNLQASAILKELGNSLIVSGTVYGVYGSVGKFEYDRKH